MKEKTTWILLVLILIVILLSAFAITNNFQNENNQTNTVNSSAVTTSSNTAVTNAAQGSNSTVQANHITWYTDLNEALTVSKKENKPIFIEFGSSSCAYCQKMNSETYSDSNVQEKLNNNYISVAIDGDSNPDLCSQYGVVGFPTLIILDSNGNVKESITGFQSASDLLSKL